MGKIDHFSLLIKKLIIVLSEIFILLATNIHFYYKNKAPTEVGQRLETYRIIFILAVLTCFHCESLSYKILYSEM